MLNTRVLSINTIAKDHTAVKQLNFNYRTNGNGELLAASASVSLFLGCWLQFSNGQAVGGVCSDLSTGLALSAYPSSSIEEVEAMGGKRPLRERSNRAATV